MSKITTDELRRAIESNEITTVVCAATDLWGRPGMLLEEADLPCEPYFVAEVVTVEAREQGGTLAVCACDVEGTDKPREMAPRNILKREIAKAAKHGITTKFASELEFFLFQDSYEEAWDKGYRDLNPTSRYNADYHILQSTKIEPIIQQIRDGMDAAGIELPKFRKSKRRDKTITRGREDPVFDAWAGEIGPHGFRAVGSSNR